MALRKECPQSVGESNCAIFYCDIISGKIKGGNVIFVHAVTIFIDTYYMKFFK